MYDRIFEQIRSLDMSTLADLKRWLDSRAPRSDSLIDIQFHADGLGESTTIKTNRSGSLAVPESESPRAAAPVASSTAAMTERRKNRPLPKLL